MFNRNQCGLYSALTLIIIIIIVIIIVIDIIVIDIIVIVIILANIIIITTFVRCTVNISRLRPHVPNFPDVNVCFQ